MKFCTYLALIFVWSVVPIVSAQQNISVSHKLLLEHTDEDQRLPVNEELDDALLAEFYDVVFPLLISWDLAHEYKLRTYLIPYNDKYDFIGVFRAGVPSNPYRYPSPDKYEFIPNNEIKWEYSKKSWMGALDSQKIFLDLAESILEEYEQNQSIQLKGSFSTLLNGLLKRPLTYQYNEFHEAYETQAKAFDILYDEKELPIETRPLTSIEEDALLKFIVYYKKRLDVFESFLYTFGNLSFRDAIKDPLLKTYFLYGSQAPNKLIKADVFQDRQYKNTEVIVFDSSHNYPSKYLNSTSNLVSAPEDSFSTPEDDLHAQSVAGIIAGTDELAQLKGVAPGAHILPISDLTPKTLKRIKQPNARVINISRSLDFPSYCSINVEHKNDSIEEADTLYCQDLQEFFTLVKEKDILIIKSAGNEGLQLEKVDLTTRTTKINLTNGLMGSDVENIIGSPPYGYNEDNLDITRIWDQIPELKDRVVIVGNLWKDGVTISPDSSLPGSFPNDFIFAPSEGISTLGKAIVKIGKHKKRTYNSREASENAGGETVSEAERVFYGDIGKFGGTSGAAPRVAGVFVILGALFPDLTMPEIRGCVLSTGDAFWFERNNRFVDLVYMAKKAGYNLKDLPLPEMEKEWHYLARIYGRGRINAEKAYYKCLDLQTAKRQKSVRMGSFDQKVTAFSKIAERDEG